MTVRTALHGICTYFGGPYDPDTRTYHSSPLADVGVSVVRRAWARDDSKAQYFEGLPDGARTGCLIVVHIPRSYENRVALGGEHGGMKRIAYEVELFVYIRSTAPHAEDAQDDTYTLRDALVEWMRQDRTLGGAVAQAGEYIDGAAGGIEFQYGQAEVTAGLVKDFLQMTFGAIEYVEA